MMLEELLVRAILAERRADPHGWAAPRPARLTTGVPGVPRYEPVIERPSPDARRILGQWLAARRAAALLTQR